MSESSSAPLSLQHLEAFLYEKIPLAQAMGVRVIEADARIVLEAPLAPNINHLGTAFGGSLHTLPTLAGYTALWTVLREAGIDSHVILKSSEASYREPVRNRLRAVCVRPNRQSVSEFIHDLRRHKKAGLELTAVVEGLGTKPAVEFSGRFVAIL